MTKKDYELIAHAINRTRVVTSMDKNSLRRYAKYATLSLLTNDLMATLAHENPKFDPDKFLAACGF